MLDDLKCVSCGDVTRWEIRGVPLCKLCCVAADGETLELIMMMGDDKNKIPPTAPE